MINENLLSSMSKDIDSNIKKINKKFKNLNYKNDENQSLLHIFVDRKYNEEKCFLAIKSLLKAGLSPNLEDCFNYNFIQTALYAGYSEKFILEIIDESLKYNLNINHVDSDKDTIMHTAIYSDDYLDEIINIYKLLCDNGFDSSKVDHDGRNLYDALLFQNQYSKETKEEFKIIFYKNINIDIENKSSELSVKESKKETIKPKVIIPYEIVKKFEKYGNVLNVKKYLTPPTIGRERELKNVMITLAQDKKSPIIVGESGVGKSAIVDELAYRIQIGEVPSFLQGRIIVEVCPSEIVSGCKYVGQFEQNMKNLIKLCEEYNAILFIDEIRSIYGVGTTEKNDNDMASIIKYYIDRSDLKMIGTTTENEYNKYFSINVLKRRFDKIVIKEPDERVLYQIIDKVIEDYSYKNQILFKYENIKYEIINILLTYTNNKYRVYKDKVNNPDLVISIIDKAYALAKIYDSEYINIDHFIESFEYCERLYKEVRKQAILKLKNINIDKPKKVSKILELNYNK